MADMDPPDGQGGEAGPRPPAVELLVQFTPPLINLRIADRQLAGRALLGVGIGTGIALGVIFYRDPELVTSAIRGALEGPGLQVVNTFPGSILVELHCATKENFLAFMEDFEKRRVKQRLEEGMQKIGYERELEVTILNVKEVYEKLNQIR